MKELETLQEMIDSTLDRQIVFTKSEFLNQLSEVVKVIASKDKEIELKDKHIEELEFKSNMYKSMIQGIFDKI